MLVICNLGSRGAGPKLTFHVSKALDNLGIPQKILIPQNSDQLDNFLNYHFNHLIVIDITSKLDLISLQKLLKFKKTIESLKLDDLDCLVFIMPHPWDRYIKSNAQIYRIIHDAQRHPGDSWWPRTFSLRARIRSGDKLITLSDHVAETVKKLGHESIIARHPDFVFDQPRSFRKVFNQVVFIGRQKKYKGGELLAEAWPLVLRKIPTATLLVAGEGKIPKSLHQAGNTKVQNEWLSESDVSALLGSSQVAVFPYIEASQSGLIGTAAKLGCRIVVTPVGGLIEQASQVGGHIADSLEPKALAEQILNALTSPRISINPSEFRNPDLTEVLGRISSHQKKR